MKKNINQTDPTLRRFTLQYTRT